MRYLAKENLCLYFQDNENWQNNPFEFTNTPMTAKLVIETAAR